MNLKFHALIPALATSLILWKASTVEHGLEALFVLTLVSAALAAGLVLFQSPPAPRAVPVRVKTSPSR